MKIKDIQNTERRTIVMSIRTFPSYSEWMKKNKISPSKLFNKAIEELKKEK